jgi:hypothetical protein
MKTDKAIYRWNDLGIVIAGAIFVVATLAAFRGCETRDRYNAPPVKHGPPTETPTIDYEELVGIDPQTQQTLEEQTRNNDLEFRVKYLEIQVRRLNQIILGIPSIRIGEDGSEETDTSEQKTEGASF